MKKLAVLFFLFMSVITACKDWGDNFAEFTNQTNDTLSIVTFLCTCPYDPELIKDKFWYNYDRCMPDTTILMSERNIAPHEMKGKYPYIGFRVSKYHYRPGDETSVPLDTIIMTQDEFIRIGRKITYPRDAEIYPPEKSELPQL